MSEVRYRTKDGFSFYTENAAKNHARSLEKEMRGVEKVELDAKPKKKSIETSKQVDADSKQEESTSPKQPENPEDSVKQEQGKNEDKQEADLDKQDATKEPTVLKPIDEYNVPQLKELADSLELECSSKVKKADLYQMLVEALADKDEQSKND